MVDWDEVLIKVNVLGVLVVVVLDCYGGSSDNKDCGVELIFFECTVVFIERKR